MSNIKNDSDKYVLKTYSRYPLNFVDGEGIYLFTDDGKKVIDMASGIAVSALGYSHPRLIEAVCSQAGKIMHLSNLYYSGPYTKLAKNLVEKSIFDRVFFCNSGAEANESALKLSRKHGNSSGIEGKTEIITMKNSFHGRTLATISATGQLKYQKGFEPVVAGFKYVEYNNIAELEQTVSEKTASIIIEVLQGEGGIHQADAAFIQRARELCDQYNALLIFDEVQTGVGRTGKLFGYEHFLPVEPDAISLAKGLGGGMPIGALLLKEKCAHLLGPGEHASTFGGNLVSCAAANAVLETIEEEKILDNVRENGEYFRKNLRALQEKYPVITDVRGLGLLNGIEVSSSGKELVNKLMEENVITVPAGDHVVRFIPPLIIKKEEIDRVIEILENILEKM